MEEPHGHSYHISQYISLADWFVLLVVQYFVDGSGMNIILHRACAHGWVEFTMSIQGGSKDETTCKNRSGVVIDNAEN